MIPIYNVRFLIKKSKSSECSMLWGGWNRYYKPIIEIPNNIYNEHCKCVSIRDRHIDIISIYLLGWFYKYNEDIIHLDDVEEILVENWSLEND
jgi:hypothetical protein